MSLKSNATNINIVGLRFKNISIYKDCQLAKKTSLKTNLNYCESELLYLKYD